MGCRIRENNDLEFFAHIELTLVLHADHIHLIRLYDFAMLVLLTELFEVEDVSPGQ